MSSDGLQTSRVRDAVADAPGVDTGVRGADGTRLFDVATEPGAFGSDVLMTVPLKSDLESDDVLAIYTTAVQAVSENFGEITLVRRGGTPSESRLRTPLHGGDEERRELHYWWELTTTPGIAVTMGDSAADADLIVDATALPDASPDALSTFARLRGILADPPPALTLPERETWIVRGRGPEITLVARAGHLIDRDTWEGLNTPALDGIVESIAINTGRDAYSGLLMTAEVEGHRPDGPGLREGPPAAASISITGTDSPALSSEVTRALHSVGRLRYLTLTLDDPNPYGYPYVIDLDACSAEASQERGDTGWIVTGELSPREEFPPRGASDEANRAAWRFFRLLGCG